MKKTLIYTLLLGLLIGCGSNNIITTEQTTTNNTTFNNSTANGSTTEPSSTFITPSTSTLLPTTSFIPTTSSSTTLTLKTIREIKEESKKFIGLENEVGVYESDVSVSIKLKLLSVLDAITTKKGYGNRYKILMTDGKDYIYLKATDTIYEYLKNYVQQQDVYLVNGNISLYNGEVEITVNEKVEYLENEKIEIDYSSLAEFLTLEEIYQEISTLKLNCKGIAFSKIVKVEVKCLAKDINNTNLYFGNGDYIINVHGHNKVTNSFTVGSSYVLYGAIQMHNFRPGLEYVASSRYDGNIEFSTESALNMPAKDFYKYSYEVDKKNTYPQYSSLFYHPYKITGYVNSYLKDNKEYIVFEDSFNENYYSTYQNAKSANAVFFVNENYVGLLGEDINYCPLYDYLESGEKVEITIFPYLWNTLKYPQVYCYDYKVVE